MAVNIIIDSSTDIGAAEAEQLGVKMIPMRITFGTQEYYDGVNLSGEEFYQKLISEPDVPKTAQIPPYSFQEAYKEATKNGDEAIAIILSSKLSGTYNSALQVASEFNGKVYVVDSLSATVGARLLCQYALRLVKEGLSAKEIFDKLEEVKGKICVSGVLETLDYLKKGGRISSAAAIVGNMLNLKPVIRVIDGEVKVIGKARGKRKGVEMLNSWLEETAIDFDMPYGVLYTGLDKSIAQEYVAQFPEIWMEGEKTPIYLMGSTIGAHIGPGVVGFAYFKQ